MKMNKDTIVKNTFTAFALVLILVIEGCFSFLTLSWDWAVLTTVIFWVGVATRILLQILTRTASMNTFLPVARDKNKDLDRVKLKNERLSKLKDSDFPKWVENDLNLQIRREQWIIQINKKLAKLERKAKYKDRSLWLMDESTHPGVQIQKDKNRYCRKKKEYLSLLEDSYINQNIVNLPVKKCPHVDPALFDIPVTNVSNTDKYQLVAKTKQAILWTLTFATLTLTISTTIKNALQFGYNKETLITALVSMLVDVFFLCWQFVRGIADSYKIINDQEVIPYVNRNRILTQYVEYKTPEDRKDTLKQLLDQFENKKTDKEEKKEAAAEVVHKVAGAVAPYLIK